MDIPYTQFKTVWKVYAKDDTGDYRDVFTTSYYTSAKDLQDSLYNEGIFAKIERIN